MRGTFARLLFVPALLLWAFTARAAVPMTKLNMVVTTESGRPIDQASVIVRFVRGHAVFKLKKLRTTYELRDQPGRRGQGTEIPQGEIRIQVIAKGYQEPSDRSSTSRKKRKTIDIKAQPAATAVFVAPVGVGQTIGLCRLSRLGRPTENDGLPTRPTPSRISPGGAGRRS